MKRSPLVLGAFILLFAVSGMVLMRQVSQPHVCCHTIGLGSASCTRRRWPVRVSTSPFEVPAPAAKLPLSGSGDCCWPKCQSHRQQHPLAPSVAD